MSVGISAEMICPACGALMRPALSADGPFCTSCGRGLRPSDLDPVLPLQLDDGVWPATPVRYEPPPPLPPHPGLGGAVLWCLGIIVFVTILPGAIGGFFAAQQAGVSNANNAAALMESPTFAQAMIPWMIAGQILSISIVCLAIVRVTKPETARQIGLRLPSGYHLLLSILALPAIMVVATGVDGLAGLVLPRIFDVEGSLAMMATWPWYVAVLMVGFGPGIGEELWFRAFIGRGLVARHGVVFGVLLTSLLFGLVHLDPRHAIVAMTMGIGLHLIYLATGSLWVPMLLHTLNNTAAILTIAGEQASFIEATAAEVPWTVYSASVILLGAVGWSLYQTRVHSTEGPKLDLDQQQAFVVDGVEPRPSIVGWVVPVAAACLFAAFSIRASIEYERQVDASVLVVPARSDVEAMVVREPFSQATWPVWSERLRDWLPDTSGQSDPAFAAARDFLAKQYANEAFPPPMDNDAMAWYLQGSGTLPWYNETMYAAQLGHRAEPLLRRSIAIDPKIGRTRYALAAALFMQGYGIKKSESKIAEARRYAAEAERLDPTANAKAAEAWAVLALGHYDVAERLMREAARERPRDKGVKTAAAEVAQIQEMRRNGHGSTIRFHKVCR
jgi:uncharacterized protein